MDATVFSPNMLHERMRGFPGPLIVDVRGDAARAVIPGAIVRDAGRLAEWAPALEIGRRVAVYCDDGKGASPRAAAALRERGLAAVHLDGGVASWEARGLKLASRPGTPGKWITRERPKVDRIACPWLIRRFVDPDAQILYVPAAEVEAAAARTGATPFDVPGVKFGHDGAHCSFDAFVRHYRLEAPALAALAEIVRGADTGRPELTAQSPGLLALSGGLSAVFDDDQRQLLHGLVLYDALYAWCLAQTDAEARRRRN